MSDDGLTTTEISRDEFCPSSPSFSCRSVPTLESIAEKLDRLCINSEVRDRVEMLVADAFQLYDNYGGEDSEWLKLRRLHFEQHAIDNPRLRDLDGGSKDPEFSSYIYNAYEREIMLSEVAELRTELRSFYEPLPYTDKPSESRPAELIPAGTIRIIALCPQRLLPCSNPKPEWPLPPDFESIDREYRVSEIITALVFIHDADKRFAPIISQDNLLRNHNLYYVLAGIIESEDWIDWAGMDRLFPLVLDELQNADEDSGGMKLASDKMGPRPDGPCAGYKWQYEGAVTKESLQPRNHALAKYLYDRIGNMIPISELIGPGSLFGDDLGDPDQTIPRYGRKLNQWFKQQDIPLSVGSNTREKYIYMEESSDAVTNVTASI